MSGCHSNNTPPAASTAGLLKDGTNKPPAASTAGLLKDGTKKQRVYLPNFVRPHEAKPNGVNTPFITVWVSYGNLQYTITDDLQQTWPSSSGVSSSGYFTLPAAYNWVFITFSATPYKKEAQVTGPLLPDLYTKCPPPNNADPSDPNSYNVGWSTTAP